MCIRPIHAFKNPEGGTPLFHPDGDLHLPCQTCHQCLKLRATDFATRVQHELSYYKENCFVTLTYNDETKPNLLQFKERRLFTLFLKDLRYRLYPTKIKYLASHEYGSKTNRPHHHLIIFGHSFSNWKHHSTTKKGNPIYTSPELSSLWTHGHSSLGDANAKTAYYIASYALKSRHHDYTDPTTGETFTIKDKMTCSRSLGLQYLIDNQHSLVEYTKLPRYYKKILQERYMLEHTDFFSIKNDKERQKLLKRFQALKDLNPSLHEHYDQKIAQTISDLPQKTPHELLASLEINEAKNEQHSDFRDSKSSLDQKIYQAEQYRLRNKTKDIK